jgi:hypothetical protein
VAHQVEQLGDGGAEDGRLEVGALHRHLLEQQRIADGEDQVRIRLGVGGAESLQEGREQPAIGIVPDIQLGAQRGLAGGEQEELIAGELPLAAPLSRATTLT